MDILARHLKKTLGFPQVTIYSLKTVREPAVALLWQSRGPHPTWESVPIEGDAILVEVLSKTEPIVVANAKKDPRTNKDVVKTKGVHTLVFLPMLLSDGSRYFVSTGTFGDEEWTPEADSLNYLAEIGYHTSLALDRLNLSEERLLLSTESAHTEKLELLGRMAGSGAHELRNLLTVISGYTALITELLEPDSEAACQSLKIEKAAGKAGNVVKSLLAFSHKSNPTGETLQLGAVTRGMEAVFAGLHDGQVSISLDISPDLGPVLMRRDDYEQLLIHLVSNAVYAIDGPGDIKITLTRTGARFAHERESDWVRLTIQDNGCGLCPVTVQQAFDPFFTTHPSAQHSGLGLSICYGIVNQSGGHISIESTTDQGTSVKVMLPMVSEPAEVKTLIHPRIDEPEENSYVGALLTLGRDLLKAEGLDEILQAGRNQIREQLGLHALLVYIAREDPPKVVELWNFLGNLDAVVVPQSFDVETNKLAKAAITSEETIVVPDARTSPLTDKRITERLGSRTLISVPFKLADGRRGALGTGSFGAQGVYNISAEQLEFLEALAGLIVVALDRRQILEERRSLRRKFLRGRHLEAVSRLGQGLADDIRNALTAIDGFTHLTQISLPEEHEAQVPLSKIEKASQQAARLLNKIVAFTRPDISHISVFDLNQLLHSVRPALQNLVEDMHLEISTTAAPCFVRADWSQMEQVVVNLVFNASAASQPGDTITLATEFGDSTVTLKVIDQGRGMSDEVRSMALEPFFTTKPPGSGTGLGLPTCRRIIAEAGGKVRLESQPGRGTTVSVELPPSEPNLH